MQEKYEQKKFELFICRTINEKKSLSRIDSSKLKIAKRKMDNYALVIDISSDEENQRYSTPIKTLPVNMVGRLNLSDSSVEVWRGSEEVRQTLIPLKNQYRLSSLIRKKLLSLSHTRKKTLKTTTKNRIRLGRCQN